MTSSPNRGLRGSRARRTLARDLGTLRTACVVLFVGAAIAACGGSALQTENPPSQATPAAQTVIWACGGIPSSRPRELVLACADGNSKLARLRWHQWGYQNATAAGIATENACMPDCANGHWVSFPVRVIASQLTLGQRYAAYGALTVDAVGKPPGQVLGHQVVPLFASGPGGGP